MLPPVGLCRIDARPQPDDMKLMRYAALLVLMAMLPGQTLQAQPAAPRVPGPFRVVNATGGTGMQFYLVRSGEDWGPSRIGNPLPPGSTLNLRANPRSGCELDVRLVLDDGREAVLRKHDICALPTVTLSDAGPAASGPRSPGLMRIENRTGVEAMQLYLANAGENTPPSNRLARPLAPGDSIGMRPGRSATCTVDARLLLADGKEVRKQQDICALPTLLLGNAPAPPPPRPASPPAPQAMPRLSTGTGFIVSEARVLTNRHVVQSCERIMVQGPDNRVFPAQARTDPALDLAVLNVPGLQGQPLSFRSAPVRRGEDAVVFGFPLAGVLSSDPKLTRGEISGLNGLRDSPAEYQVSAPIQPGNSGGPLLDMRGDVMGVVVAVLGTRGSGGNPAAAVPNIGFAIKGDRAVAFLRRSGIRPNMGAAEGPALTAADVGDIAGRATVLVRCEGRPPARR